MSFDKNTSRDKDDARQSHRLKPKDWVYLLSLLVPFVFLTLSLKIARITELPAEHGLAGSLTLLRSDLLFNLGYMLFWVGVFVVARSGAARLLAVVSLHVATILLALISVGADQYYKVTGTSLGMDPALFFLSSPGEFSGVVGSEVSPGMVIALLLVLAYAILGPWAIVRLIERQRKIPAGPAEPGHRISWLGLGGLGLVAFGALFFSTLPSGGPAGASNSFARDPLVNVLMTELERIRLESRLDMRTVASSPLDETRLAQTERTGKKNVVLIHLESTRAKSVDPYNGDVSITPYLDELSEQSLFAERGYAVVPHTTSALVAAICGMEPPSGPRSTDSVGDDIPANCLPELLGDQGYRTAYFTSSVQTFERRPEVVENLGFDEFYPVETMDTKGFQKANYFGYEDDVMLEPSRNWLEENGDEPFVTAYETITPHHDYQAPDRYGIEEFAEDDTLNRYQNSVKYVDFFLKNLIQQYKDLGLYEDTVFVIYGDHGEAFGEHGRNQHDMIPWEEGVKTPLMVLDPSREPQRVEKPANQLDILPTVTDLLGYRVEGGKYPGSSMLDLPEDRPLYFSCWSERGCLASLEGDMKYIYHYGDKPEELYDLSKDPEERDNLADKANPRELERLRNDLLAWRANAEAAYQQDETER